MGDQDESMPKTDGEPGNDINSQHGQIGTGLNNLLSGVERSLSVTCEAIMDKMKHLEERIQEMDDRFQELAKDAEKALQEAKLAENTTNGNQNTGG